MNSKLKKILIVLAILAVLVPLFSITEPGLNLYEKAVAGNKDSGWAPWLQRKVAQIHWALTRYDKSATAYLNLVELLEKRQLRKEASEALYAAARAYWSAEMWRESRRVFSRFLENYEDMEELADKVRKDKEHLEVTVKSYYWDEKEE